MLWNNWKNLKDKQIFGVLKIEEEDKKIRRTRLIKGKFLDGFRYI